MLRLPPVAFLVPWSRTKTDPGGIGRSPRRRYQDLAQGGLAAAVLLDRPQHARGDAAVQGRAITLGDFGGDPAPRGLGVAPLALRLGGPPHLDDTFGLVGRPR